MYYILRFLLIAIDRILGSVIMLLITPFILIILWLGYLITWLWKFESPQRVVKWYDDTINTYIKKDLWNAIRFRLSGVEFLGREDNK